jgi:hypothetical protein
MEKIIQETLQGHHTSISIGGTPLCNLHFPNDINLMDGSNSKLQDLTNSQVDRGRAYGMGVSTEKSKVIVNSTSNISANITMNGENVEVTSFKYLGANFFNDGPCTAEEQTSITTVSAAMARLIHIWKRGIIFLTKNRLYKSLAVSIVMGVKHGL